MRGSLFLFLTGLFLGCRAPTGPSPVTAPPVAARRPVVSELHGDRRVDDYAWLRQARDPAVLAHLRAENAFTEWMMRDTQSLQETLYREFLERIEETDQTVPYRRGDWWYFQRTLAGRQYPIYCRQRGATNAVEEIILDQNQLAAGHKYFDLGALAVSDDGQRLAYTTDATGRGDYVLQVKDLRTGKLLPLRRPRVASFTWAADNRTLFYVTENAAKRAYRLWRVDVDRRRDTLLYEEPDDLFYLAVGRSQDRHYLFASSASKTATEIRYLRADQPGEEWTVFRARQPDCEYALEHAGAEFLVRINDTGRNFRLVAAPVQNPATNHWRELVAHRPAVMLAGVLPLAGYQILLEREEGLPKLRVRDAQTGKVRDVRLPDSAYSVWPQDNAEYATGKLRYVFESFRTPPTGYDYDLATGTSTRLKQQPVRGDFRPEHYQVERLSARAADGTLIPVSLVYRKDKIVAREPRPMVLDGYGAYGIPEDVWFSAPRLSLLDRGVIFAIAHVRGGGEFGPPWHDAGRMAHKGNTFRDFITVAEQLIAEQYTTADRLVITGGSAGGLLIGAVLNLRPELFAGALLEMPFVDVLNTMLDESLPLTVTEFEEWGNPKVPAQYARMRTYCPYTNLRAQAYPPILVKTSWHDSRVGYWEPAKYVAKLRAVKTDANPVLLRIELEAGHGGRSGRYDALREQAFDYAWLLKVLLQL
jgi:oligopeptidase B